MNIRLAIGILIVTTLIQSLPNQSQAVETAVDLPNALNPVDREAKWWVNRHQTKLKEKQNRADSIKLVFVGDSITHSWEKTGASIWKEKFAPYGALNLGYSGDRTEHVLWRIGKEGGEIEGLDPKLYVLMIGTNNTGQNHDSDPAETAEGVSTIVQQLLVKSPSCKVLLLAIFPRGATADNPLRKRNSEINTLIASLDENERVEFLNINQVFLDEEGNLPKEIMPDLLHPNLKGYQLWADAIEAPIKRLMTE